MTRTTKDYLPRREPGERFQPIAQIQEDSSTYSGEVNEANTDSIVSRLQVSVRVDEHANDLDVLIGVTIVVRAIIIVDIPSVEALVIGTRKLILDGVNYVLAYRRICVNIERKGHHQ